MTTADKLLKDGIRVGKFIMAYGMIDVALKTGARHCPLPKGRMMVLVFGWEGSGFQPDHHSLN